MDSLSDLRHITTRYFDSINFTELNDRWIDAVIDNEFTDAEENDITISILFVNDPKQTLIKLADVCFAWCQKTVNESVCLENSDTSSRGEVLWTILDELGVGVKHIQSLIYLLCSRALKKSASKDDKALSLASSEMYFNCLRVPGSAAYSVYHPNLFYICIDCMPVPDFTSDKDNSSLRDFETFYKVYSSALLSLIPLLKEYHLGDDSSIIERTIKKLAEITTCEVQMPINFNINFSELGQRELMRRYKSTFIVSALAYETLAAILDTDLNGDIDRNYIVMLSYLNKSILCFKLKKGQNINQKHLLIKENAVAFVCHNLRTREFCSEVSMIALKRLCLGVGDKAELRHVVSSAIITILFHLKSEHVIEMVQWILLLIDSAETKDRVVAVEVFAQFLSNTYEVDPSRLPEALKNDLFNMPIIFSILTRCDDVSPAVRTRALTVLSQNMKCIFNFLDKTKDYTTFEIEDSDNMDDKSIDINGNHRYFWYNLTSLRERLNQIESILQRRLDDNNSAARKAALVALENLMVFDITYINEENFKFFYSMAKDPNVVIRKQMVQSLAVLLQAYHDNSEIQELWIKCIIPLVQDNETSVQEIALSALQEQFLQNIFSSVHSDRECAFTILKFLCSGDYFAHQRYFQKAFSLWKSGNKLRPQTALHLEKYIGTDLEECVWFFLSNFALYCSLPSKVSHRCMEQFEKFHGDGVYPSLMQYMLKVLMHIFPCLPTEKLERVKSIICDSLKLCSIPVELIPVYVEILYKINKHCKTESDFAEFSSKVIQKYVQHLTEIKSKESFPDPPSEELLAKYFCSIKEFCQLCPSNITPDVISVLKTYSASVDLPKPFLKILSPSLKAHAFAALGKICLQDEILTKELLSVFADALLTSKHDVIRSNIVIILIEMCKRYTSFADKYVPLISLCFKDKLYLIRYQTIVLVVNLLQEGYIKWRGALFFCLLSSLVDKKEAIQELGRYSLTQLLSDKKKSLFSEHFIDSIFVFNHFPPPDNETVAQSVKDLERFAIPGESRRDERMILYKFLLFSMDVREKAYLIKAICEILMSVAETVYSLNETTECMVRDCFAILICKEIRAYNLEEFEEIEESSEVEFHKAELNMRRVVIIDPIIPVIVSLKNGITDPESDLMQDIILFLKDLLHDFKDTFKDILAVDKILLRQLELEIKNEAERERAEKKMEKELKDKNKQTSSEQTEQTARPSVTIEGIQTMIKDVSKYMEEGKDLEGKEKSPRKTPSPKETPKGQSRMSRSARQLSRSVSRDSAINRPSTSAEGMPSMTFNITNPAEASEIHRLASTPRVVLTKFPLTTNILNVSAIINEQMNVDDSDEE